MGTRDIRIDLGQVDLGSLATDEDLRGEARRILPKAIVQLGEAVGEEAWNALQKGLKGPGIKLNTSSSDKRKFIRESGQNHKREISCNDKKKLEDEIIRRLREQKQSAS